MTALRAVVRVLSPLIVSAVVALVLWVGCLRVFAISPLVGKPPQAVWDYLFVGDTAAQNRSDVLRPLLTTLRDGGVGFAAGMVTALVVAILFVLFRSLEQAFMPVAMLLRSVPLVAMTPLIVLVFGHGLRSVAVITGIVVFFPALVNIALGLRSAPPQATDLVRAYGGSELTVLRRVALPTALPSIFAAARISVPGCLIGALLAEWLATAKGTGGQILRDIGAFGYGNLWASIVVLTSVSVIGYTAVGVIESLTLARFGPSPGSA